MDALEPAREAAAADFGVDVWAWAGDEVNACFGGGVEELLETENAFGREGAWGAFEEGPMGVEGDGVVAQSFDFLENV